MMMMIIQQQKSNFFGGELEWQFKGFKGSIARSERDNNNTPTHVDDPTTTVSLRLNLWLVRVEEDLLVVGYHSGRVQFL